MAKKPASAKELRGRSEDQLKADVAGMKKEQFNLRFQSATGQLEKTGEVKKVRRQIARMKTVLREKTGAGKV